VFDIIQEQVFVSGPSVLNRRLQRSVGKSLLQIEIQADVGWCERLESLQGCLVVVLLMHVFTLSNADMSSYQHFVLAAGKPSYLFFCQILALEMSMEFLLAGQDRLVASIGGTQQTWMKMLTGPC
jgi:hypothetical protein